MKQRDEYKTTTNNSVYTKLHKEIHASCSYCKWHGPNSENDRWTCYSVQKTKNGKERRKYPSWKLVSKNKKQWMKKPPLTFVDRNRFDYWEYYYDIQWSLPIRPK